MNRLEDLKCQLKVLLDNKDYDLNEEKLDRIHNILLVMSEIKYEKIILHIVKSLNYLDFSIKLGTNKLMTLSAPFGSNIVDLHYGEVLYTYLYNKQIQYSRDTTLEKMPEELNAIIDNGQD